MGSSRSLPCGRKSAIISRMLHSRQPAMVRIDQDLAHALAIAREGQEDDLLVEQPAARRSEMVVVEQGGALAADVIVVAQDVLARAAVELLAHGPARRVLSAGLDLARANQTVHIAALVRDHVDEHDARQVRHELRRVDIAARRQAAPPALALPIRVDRADRGMAATEKVSRIGGGHGRYLGRMAATTVARYRPRSAMRMGRHALNTKLQGLNPTRQTSFTG